MELIERLETRAKAGLSNPAEVTNELLGLSLSEAAEIVDKKIVIDDIYYRPKLIKLINNTGSNSWYEVILTEGKNREIRKIFEYFGFKVNRLIRTNFGRYSLGNLKPGEFKEVSIRFPA